MRRAMLRDARRLAAAIAVGIGVLAAPGAAAAAYRDTAALGLGPIAGDPVACVSSDNDTYGQPFSTFVLASGDSVLVRGGGAGWGLLWLSGDGRTVRRLEADVPTGRVTGAVRFGNGRVLVTAEQGLFAVDGDRRLQRIAGCEQIGMAMFIVRRDGGVLAFPDGSALLAGERGLLRMSPEGRIERLGELPADAGDFVVVGGDAVLVSGIFGHVLMARDGRTSLVATGARAQSFIAVRGAIPALRSKPPFRSGDAAPQPVPRAMALMDRNGRTTWTKVPDDVRNVSYPVELDDGRIFWVTDRGLLRLRSDGSLQLVSAAVRLACGDARGGDGETIVQAMAGGRTLVHADGLLFIIDRKDRVQPVVGQVDCAKRLYKRGFAATNDGSVYFKVEEALYRRDPGGRVRALPVAGATGMIWSVEAFGDVVLVHAKEGLFHTRSGQSLRRVAPQGQDAYLSSVSDPDGRPLICVDKNALHRLDARGDLQPLRAAAGVDCGGGVRRAGSLGLLMGVGTEGLVLVTRDDRAIAIPGARVWPVAQIRDGSVILLSLPASPGESWGPRQDEELSLPHSLIRVSPQGRVEPVAFDGPEVELKPQRDPTWQERSEVRAIHFTSPTRGWAVLGERGLLSTTVDGGAQWRGVTSDDVPIAGVASLAFSADGRHGIAAGKDALWRTDDAGATWAKTPWQREIFDVHQIRLLGSAGARAVAVVDRRHHDNIVVELWVSDDGGRTWTAPALPVPGPLAWARDQIAGVGFDAAGQGGWLVAADRLLVTGDGGNTWQQLADLRDYREVEGRRWRLERPRVVYFFGQTLAHLPGSPVAMAIWAPGETWCIARWKLFCISPNVERPKSGVQEVAIDPDALVAALAVESDGKRGWAVGTRGLILATEDGGKTWAPQPSGVQGTLGGVFFLPDALHGWVWGENGILLTRDGGKSWEPAGAR